jgi:hypothetical protein
MRGRLRTCDTRKLLVGSDPAMRAALARVMLDTLRELVDTHQVSLPEIPSAWREAPNQAMKTLCPISSAS